MILPVQYDKLSSAERKAVREEYVMIQNGRCWYCNEDLSGLPPQEVLLKKLNRDIFPPGFLKSPIHLQHDHNTGFTEGAVHAHCNGVLWQYERR